jgi:hypothetical protein
MKFPELSGENLEKKKYIIPNDLEGDLNFLIVPFHRWQQGLVDNWVPFLAQIQKSNPKFRFYEIPTLNSSYKVMRFVIDGGMRAGIPDRTVRERTITAYLNKSLFKTQLQIRSEDTISLFLVRKNGEILWRTEGDFNNHKADQLIKVIEDFNN